MAMTHTVASNEADLATDSPSTKASMAVVVREIPVVIKSTVLAANFVLTQYYQTLRVEGFADLLPEVIEIDPAPIAQGGEMRIDQIALPPCCEVIGVWFANPVISVEQMM
jgi:hypothetical protein